MKGGAKPRRVALVIGQLSYGGAESQLYELARRLPPEYRPIVYCLSTSVEPYGNRLRDAGVMLRVIPSRGHFDPSRVWRLARLLRADRIDLVHAFLFIASTYAFLATRIYRRPAFISSARNCKFEPNPLRRWLIGRAFAASDAVVCNSAEMARFAASLYGVRKQQARVVYNGVDTQRFVPGGQRPATLRVGTVGRLEAQKNVEMFLDAALTVAARVPEARFEILGEGSQRASLERGIERRGLADRVCLAGTREGVAAFLQGLSPFWLTSDWEGTPNVVLEAMASGLPVLCTRVGGIPELVDDGHSGVLLEAGGDARLAEESLRLHAQPDVAAGLGRRAREVVQQRFSLTAMVETTLQVYQDSIREAS